MTESAVTACLFSKEENVPKKNRNVCTGRAHCLCENTLMIVRDKCASVNKGILILTSDSRVL